MRVLWWLVDLCQQSTLAFSSHFMHHSAAWSNKHHDTHPYKKCVLTGNRTQVEFLVARNVSTLPQGQPISVYGWFRLFVSSLTLRSESVTVHHCGTATEKIIQIQSPSSKCGHTCNYRNYGDKSRQAVPSRRVIEKRDAKHLVANWEKLRK